jgi:6-pyruvoyltetrahydropterin/6-carboxytetrahydropterin synthase
MSRSPQQLFRVTKTYGHNLGLSACFRQWAAKSHCRFLHGYALQIELVFEAPRLNHNNWVVDFGSLKPIKKWLEETFDHKTLIAQDDPEYMTFQQMHAQGLIDMITVEKTGCEGFAEMVRDKVEGLLEELALDEQLQGGTSNGVYLKSVEIREHGANSATITYG